MSELILGLLCFGDIYFFVIAVIQTIMFVVHYLCASESSLEPRKIDRAIRVIENIVVSFVFDSVYMLYEDHGMGIDYEVKTFFALVACALALFSSMAYWKTLKEDSK